MKSKKKVITPSDCPFLYIHHYHLYTTKVLCIYLRGGRGSHALPPLDTPLKRLTFLRQTTYVSMQFKIPHNQTSISNLQHFITEKLTSLNLANINFGFLSIEGATVASYEMLDLFACLNCVRASAKSRQHGPVVYSVPFSYSFCDEVFHFTQNTQQMRLLCFCLHRLRAACVVCKSVTSLFARHDFIGSQRFYVKY